MGNELYVQQQWETVHILAFIMIYSEDKQKWTHVAFGKVIDSRPVVHGF